jgi:uncharacterized membrane protein YhaH (DUF805 family)
MVVRDYAVTLGQKLFGFKGRLRRRDWWIFSILIFLAQICGGIAAVALLSTIGLRSTSVANFTTMVVFLGLQWPSAAINVQRFHDRSRRGWPGVLLVFGSSVYIMVMLLGELDLAALQQRNDAAGWLFSLFSFLWTPLFIWFLIVLGLADGTPGPNRFGPSPKGLGEDPATGIV